jgi:4-diphosphocytidyl-2-C-methyl-D-erythritol kinase
MENALTVKAYAKINLHLDVTGRLDNGYHTISSVMQQVSLFDEITVSKGIAGSDEKIIRITCTEPSIPTDGKNIVYKCANAFFEHFAIASYNIVIHIEKRIPHAAGLAGGSTDGAAVLRILPILFEIAADTETLCQIGSRIGADIPFCILGGTCLAEGIGEKLTPVSRLFRSPVLIAIGGEGISTPEAYGRIDAMYSENGYGKAGDYTDWLASSQIPSSLYNIFETVILPERMTVSELKKVLSQYGAYAAIMSGSGTAVFGLFQSEESASKAASEIASLGYFSHIARPVSNIMI